MRTPTTMASFAAGAIFAVAVGGGTAVAATGGHLVIGRSNAESSTTTVTNSGKTPPLSLVARGGVPALQVNTAARVPNLNADTVDGLEGSSLARTTGRSGSIDGTSELVDLDHDGTDDAIIAVSLCPSGSQMTGGGVSDYTSSGFLISSAPGSGGEEWLAVVGIDPSAAESADDVVATVVCYNPLGKVGAGSYDVAKRALAHPLSHVSPAVLARVRARVEASR